MEYQTFDDWYAAFKRAAGAANPQLKQDGSRSLIDFMKHEPLKRAFRDGIDPEALGMQFAKQFDASTFFGGPKIP